MVIEAAKAVDFPVKRGGTYVCMEGPAFSTRAESKLYRSWGHGLDRDDQPAGSEIGARSRDLLRRQSRWSPTTIAGTRKNKPSASDMLIGYLMQNSQNVQRLIKKTVARTAGEVRLRLPKCAEERAYYGSRGGSGGDQRAPEADHWEVREIAARSREKTACHLSWLSVPLLTTR